MWRGNRGAEGQFPKQIKSHPRSHSMLGIGDIRASIHPGQGEFLAQVGGGKGEGDKGVRLESVWPQSRLTKKIILI